MPPHVKPLNEEIRDTQRDLRNAAWADDHQRERFLEEHLTYLRTRVAAGDVWYPEF